jgi:hypothetical protein
MSYFIEEGQSIRFKANGATYKVLRITSDRILLRNQHESLSMKEYIVRKMLYKSEIEICK